jgi:hypothetical protein
MNFPLLTGPLESLTVINQDLERPVEGFQYPLAPPLNISFPALEGAFYVDLGGNISRFEDLLRLQVSRTDSMDSIYMPNFQTLYLYSENDAAVGPQFIISNSGNPLDITLPKLSNITSLSLEGSIKR